MQDWHSLLDHLLFVYACLEIPSLFFLSTSNHSRSYSSSTPSFLFFSFFFPLVTSFRFVYPCSPILSNWTLRWKLEPRILHPPIKFESPSELHLSTNLSAFLPVICPIFLFPVRRLIILCIQSGTIQPGFNFTNSVGSVSLKPSWSGAGNTSICYFGFLTR